MTLRIIALLLLLIACAGCSGDSEKAVLVDYCFDESMGEPQMLPVLAQPGVHSLGAGWHVSEKGGRWILGYKAVVECFLAGRNLELELVCSTSPSLSELGQGLTVRLNGQPVARFALTDGWAPDTTTVILPADVIVQGTNTIELRPEIAGEDPELDGKAIFVRRLRVTARLDRKARRLLADMAGRAPEDTY